MTHLGYCSHCEIWAHLDRAGWCALCLWEAAHQHVYVNMEALSAPMERMGRLRL